MARSRMPRPHIDDFVLTDVVSHLLRRAHFRAENIFTEAFAPTGLTPRQKALLIISLQHPGASQNELAERIAIDRNSFADMVKRLVARGLMRRERSEADARAWSLTITERGERLLEQVMPRDAEVEELIIAPLPAELRPAFVRCLKILAGLEPVAPDSPPDPGANRKAAGEPARRVRP